MRKGAETPRQDRRLTPAVLSSEGLQGPGEGLQDLKDQES